MSLPENFDTKDLFRYVIPGIVALVILLPYIDVFLPSWSIYSSAERIGYSLFLILAFGLVIEIIVDLSAGPVASWCCKRKWINKAIGLDPDDPTFCKLARARKVQLIVGLTVDDRDLVWRSTAVAHMLTGTAIVFFFSIILNLAKMVSLLLNTGLSFFSSNYFIGIFSFFGLSIIMVVISLRLAITYAQYRQDYYDAFEEKYKKT